MANETTIDLASLRFEGERFKLHALDVECTQELIAYRNIVVECAKELWRRKNPDRARLPRGFEGGFRLQFDRLAEGSTLVPLQRVCLDDQVELDLGNLDEFDEAAELIDAAIAAANGDNLLPEALPSNIVPLFRDFGKSLRPDEVLFTQARHSAHEAPYTTKARDRLAAWLAPFYEDLVDAVGEVRMASVGPGTFTIQLDGSQSQVSGHFTPDQESVLLEALRDHQVVRLRVQGTAEFDTVTREIKRFLRVDSFIPAAKIELEFDESAAPIWDQLAAIGASAPEGAWDSVPDDLSTRIDDLVYRPDDDPS